MVHTYVDYMRSSLKRWIFAGVRKLGTRDCWSTNARPIDQVLTESAPLHIDTGRHAGEGLLAAGAIEIGRAASGSTAPEQRRIPLLQQRQVGAATAPDARGWGAAEVRSAALHPAPILE